MTPEGKVKKAVKALLDSLKPDLWYFMPVPFGYGVSGIPDFVGVYHGRFFGIETKRAGEGKARARQELIARMIREAGGTVWLENDASLERTRLELAELKCEV